MTSRDDGAEPSPRPLSRVLADVAERVQARSVLPHCPTCRQPCCRLDTLVLELTWRRLKGLWGLDASRREFDQLLERGGGPTEIRSQDGYYYAHGRVCPAYRGGKCEVYGNRLKPTGCSDFPLYQENGGLVADLRCEAVVLQEVEWELRRTLGARYQVERSRNPEFPFLVTWRARRLRSKRRHPAAWCEARS